VIARRLAGPRAGFYLAAAALLAAAGCAPPPPLVPVGGYAPVTAAEFRAVAAGTVPAAPELLMIRWRFDQDDAPVTGRGAVRLAPPDSLRLDVAVPVIGRATLVLAGDSAWAQPERLVDRVLPAQSVLWAMLGVVRVPADVTRIERGAAPDRQLYRLTGANGVVTILELRGDTLLAATSRRGTRTVGRLALTRNAQGAIVRAVTEDEEHGVRFVVDVDRRQSGEVFPHEIWRRP
jgi:hypothetical protein